MNVILYGYGEIGKRIYEKVNEDQYHILAVADKKFKGNEGVFIEPSYIKSFDYDIIAVCTTRYYEQVREELIGEYFIDEKKIVSGLLLLEENGSELGFELLKSLVSTHSIKSVLDYNAVNILKYKAAVQESFLSEIKFDGIIWGTEIFSSYYNIYNKIYDGNEHVSDLYDAVLIYDDISRLDEIKKGLNPRFIVIIMHRMLTDVEEEILRRIGPYKCYREKNYIGICLRCVEKEEENRELRVGIYVVTHKKYNITVEDRCYIPICVGAYENNDFIHERTGTNISNLNEKINECTVMYWIWKNSNKQIVGLNHYRRFFFNDKDLLCRENRLTEENIVKILKEYDIILPESTCFSNQTVEEQLRQYVDVKAFNRAKQLIEKYLKCKQPAYWGAYKDVMGGHVCYTCNLFIAPKSLISRFFEWLFSFLQDAAEEFETSDLNSYDKRMIGFFAERMLTVWLRKEKLKIKELPILY